MFDCSRGAYDAAMFSVTVRSDTLSRALDRLAAGMDKPAPLMREIGHEMEVMAEQAFEKQGVLGGDQWERLAPSTIERKAKAGKSRKLHMSGQLKASLHHGGDASRAFVGAGSGLSADYAAIHQFGGLAGKHRHITMPARPYLPFTGNGDSAELTPHAERAVIRLVEYYLKSLSR